MLNARKLFKPARQRSVEGRHAPDKDQIGGQKDSRFLVKKAQVACCVSRPMRTRGDSSIAKVDRRDVMHFERRPNDSPRPIGATMPARTPR